MQGIFLTYLKNICHARKTETRYVTVIGFFLKSDIYLGSVQKRKPNNRSVNNSPEKTILKKKNLCENKQLPPFNYLNSESKS